MVAELLSLPESLVMAVQMLLTGLMYSLQFRRKNMFPLRLILGVGSFLLITLAIPRLRQPLDIFIQPLLVYCCFAVLIIFLFDLERRQQTVSEKRKITVTRSENERVNGI